MNETKMKRSEIDGNRLFYLDRLIPVDLHCMVVPLKNDPFEILTDEITHLSNCVIPTNFM